MNKKCVELLKEVINNNYHNIRLDNMSYNDDEFYYEFKSDEQVSENDLIWLDPLNHFLGMLDYKFMSIVED